MRPAPPPVAQQPKPTRRAVVQLITGESVAGLFVRADADTVKIEVAGSPLELKIENIESISFGERPTTPDAAGAAAPSEAVGTLNLEAGLIYKMGGVQPVARSEFYLLDEDPSSLMTAAGLRPEGVMGVLDVFSLAVRYDRRRTPAFAEAVRSINAHTKHTVTTDFNGRAQFTDVAPGRYYLFGSATTRRGYAIWSIPVDIRAGSNSVTLDQNNAATAL